MLREVPRRSGVCPDLVGGIPTPSDGLAATGLALLALRFEAARWGERRVGANGKALLTHLRDVVLGRIGENPH